MSEFFLHGKRPSCLPQPLSSLTCQPGQRLQPPVDSKGKSESRHFYLLAFIVVTHSPKSGLLVSTFISCLQDLRAIVGSHSAGLSKLSLVQLGFPGLSSALSIFFFWHQSWRRHASFLAKVQRERQGRSTQPHLKLLLSHGIPGVWHTPLAKANQ